MSKKKPIPLEETALIRAFNLEQVFEPTPLLKTWFETDETLNAMEQQLLEKACNNLRENANYWNEEELKMHFISICELRVEIPYCAATMTLKGSNVNSPE